MERVSKMDEGHLQKDILKYGPRERQLDSIRHIVEKASNTTGNGIRSVSNLIRELKARGENVSLGRSIKRRCVQYCEQLQILKQGLEQTLLIKPFEVISDHKKCKKT